MLNKIEQNPIITLVLIVMIMLCINIDVLDVTIMEARNFITAREMINDGNWLLTTMNGEPRYQKPPLPTWLAAISSLLFGTKSIFALRLPGILMVIITGISAYLLSVKLLQNKFHAFINGLITITSFYIIGIIIEAPWDIFTHGFMLVAILHLFSLFEKEKGYWKHTIIAGVFFGLSLLCKGPVSLYALLLPFLISYGITYRYSHFKAKYFSTFSFLIIALLIGGWWYLYVRIEDPETFIKITNKETGNWGSYNVRPFYYYWSFFTQSGLWTIPAFIALLYPYMKTRVSNLKAYRLTFLWTIFAVILLSIIPEKKSRYLMPVLIPMALNTGFYIEYLIRKIKDKKESFPVYFNFGIIALVGIAFPILGYLFLKDIPDVNWVLFCCAALVLFGIGIMLIIQLKRKNIKQVFYLTILFMVSTFILLLPLTNSLKSNTYKGVSNLKLEVEKKGLKTYSINYVAPEVIWQYGTKLPSIKANGSTYNFPEEVKFGILTKELSTEDLSVFKASYDIEALDTFNLNRNAPKTRGYKDRLISQYYILTKR